MTLEGHNCHKLNSAGRNGSGLAGRGWEAAVTSRDTALGFVSQCLTQLFEAGAAVLLPTEGSRIYIISEPPILSTSHTLHPEDAQM